jgi:hypothetical protein
MNLYYCTANGNFAPFGEYIYANTRAEAETKFHNAHGVYPNQTTLERRAGRANR